MSTLTRRLVLRLLVLFLLVPPLAGQEPNRNVRFGLPSPAKADPKQREDYLIERPQYVVGKTSDGKWAGLKTTVVET